MAAPITIDENYLNDRIREFSNDESDSSDRMNSFNWQTAAGGSVQANLSADLPLHTGVDAFTPGKDLVTRAGAVRSNFYTRLSQFNEQAGYLRSGLLALVADSGDIESLNNVSAADFGSYVKETSSGGGSSTQGGSTGSSGSPASGSGAGSSGSSA